MVFNAIPCRFRTSKATVFTQDGKRHRPLIHTTEMTSLGPAAHLQSTHRNSVRRLMRRPSEVVFAVLGRDSPWPWVVIGRLDPAAHQEGFHRLRARLTQGQLSWALRCHPWTVDVQTQFWLALQMLARARRMISERLERVLFLVSNCTSCNSKGCHSTGALVELDSVFSAAARSTDCI